MRCRNVRELLSPYIDLMLSDEDKTRVEEHLAACESCRKDLAELQNAVNRIRGMEKLEAPSDFMSGLHERLLEEKVTPFGKRRSKNHLVSSSGWLVATAASIALAFGIYVSSLVPFPVVANIFDKIPQIITPRDSELRNDIERFLDEKKQQMHTALNIQQPEQQEEEKQPQPGGVDNQQPPKVANAPENEPSGQVEEVVKPIVINTVNLQLSAAEAEQVADSIMQLAKANGARVETYDNQLMAGVTKVMTVRVTPERLSSIVTGVSSFGSQAQPMHGAQDLTQDYKNIKGRVGEVEAEITKLQGLEEMDADESNKLQAMLFEKSYLEDKLAELEANTELVAVNIMITEEPNH